jgi:hypothetical protein
MPDRTPLSALLSQLLAGLEADRDGWRARAPRRSALPHYPLLARGGGFPDGA